MLLSLLGSVAWAGVLVVNTTVPVDVRLEGASVVRSFGPLVAEIDLAAGPVSLELRRGESSQKVDLEMPVMGRTQLAVSAKAITPGPAPAPVGDPSTLELHAAPGKAFSLVMDGNRLVAFASAIPVTLVGVAPGAHSLELRSADFTLVWGRGTLTVQAGDHLQLNASEGQMLELGGHTGAWAPEQGKDSPPPAPSRTPSPPAEDTRLPEVNDPDLLGN